VVKKPKPPARSDLRMTSAKWAAKQLKDGKLEFAVDDPDAAQNWPRIWIIWRGNAMASSAKGHEFFQRHYLGTHDNIIAEEHAKGKVKTVKFREPAPRGKMDLVVDLNFRMDSSALYSDIVLPSAFWYEKNDLNTTDLHSFVHPLGQAVPPVWESKTDWEIFKAASRSKVSEMAPEVFPEPVRDMVAYSADARYARRTLADRRERLARGRVRGDPRQDHAALQHGRARLRQPLQQLHLAGPQRPRRRRQRQRRADPHRSSTTSCWRSPSAARPTRVARAAWSGAARNIPAWRTRWTPPTCCSTWRPKPTARSPTQAFKHEEERVGLPLADLAEGVRGVNMTFHDLTGRCAAR
jgi:nitrate reductase alpha subunit